MRHLWRSLFVVLLTTCSERGDDNKFTEDELTILESASEIELYSLDPAPKHLQAERFNFWSVMGKTTIVDFQQKNELVYAIKPH